MKTKTIQSKLLIEATDLSVGFKSDTPLWTSPQFSVLPGEFIGLLGPNGAGKTTLLRVLLGLQKPIAGEVKILGKAPEKGNRRIGYVPQRRYIDLDSKINAIEYVKIAINQEWFKVDKDITKKAQEALELVDGLGLAKKPLSKMSGGELQRIFLAQALVDSPDLLLLDEPLANLDIRRENELIRLVKQVVVKKNISAILIAHDINPLLPVIDKIFYIANGKMLCGSVSEIVNSEALSKLYNAPVEVLKDSKGRIAVLGTEEALHHV